MCLDKLLYLINYCIHKQTTIDLKKHNYLLVVAIVIN